MLTLCLCAVGVSDSPLLRAWPGGVPEGAAEAEGALAGGQPVRQAGRLPTGDPARAAAPAEAGQRARRE